MEIIKHIYEPTPLQCGQAVLAMITGKTVAQVVEFLQNEKETTLKEMVSFLEINGFLVSKERKSVKLKSELPEMCFLSLETPKCWHWSLYVNGVFYDPEYGVLANFPKSYRKYYFQIKKTD